MPIQIASPTDLVVMKVLAGREKDMDDLVGIFRSGPRGLDLDAARAMLEELEEALGQSDLVPTLEQARTRAGRP